MSKTSIAQGHAGAELAAENAGNDWWSKAYAALIYHAKYNRLFMAEDVKCLEDCPGDARAWGSVLLAAQKADLIQVDGIGRSNIHHGAYKTIWRSKIYIGKQMPLPFLSESSNDF